MAKTSLEEVDVRLLASVQIHFNMKQYQVPILATDTLEAHTEGRAPKPGNLEAEEPDSSYVVVVEDNAAHSAP